MHPPSALSPELLLGLVLALAASALQNTGFLSQYVDAATRPPVSARRPLRTVRSLLGSGPWLVGAALGVTAFALHVVALGLAPLSLVQSFFAGGLALAAPIAARGFGHHLALRERLSVVAMAIALAALPVGIGASTRHAAFESVTLAAYVGATIAAAGFVAALRRPASLALAAGLFYAGLDTTIKAMTGIVAHGGPVALLVSPWWAAALASFLGAFLSFQRALQTGRALSVIALTEATAIAASVTAGFVVFGDRLGSGAVLVCVHLVAFATVAVTTAVLAPAAYRMTGE